jgi:hypothetical protein
MNNQLHAGLRNYLDRMNISQDPDQQGKIVLTFDQRYRIRCWPTTGGDLILESNIFNLPADAHERAELLNEALCSAAGRLYTCSDTLILDEDENVVYVQQRIAADAAFDEFESELEQFLNALGNWRQLFTLY